MTYQELKRLTAGHSLPLAAKNEDGENVIIEHRTDHWIIGKLEMDRNYFLILTAQHNGWTRHNYIYENDSTEEFYSR